jgi:hypothetical protein
MFNGILFQESLQDLVKGIRAHRRDESAYIREKITEIAKECRSSDVAKKTTGVLKLTHLQMLGYNASFASFHIVEVMSSPDFASKRVGYLAAAQSFSPTTDVLLLTTNQFKKDLTNGRMQDCSQALTCLGKLVNESLACDLGPDVALLLSSPRPYIRKKTLLVLYRLIMVYPDTLHAVSSKFVSCLSDPDPGVVCAAVTVTCELVRAAPRTFLELAPVLYQLLTTSNNNWMLIKIVKLMGVLTPLEPRLGKKLIGPLTNLMRTTRAKSLLYECCCTVTEGLLDNVELVKLCGDRLSEFMVDPDQNLKYLGLLSMRKLVKAHPQIAMQHRDLILDCLDDEDIGIRMRALELVAEFVTRRTLRDISRILLRKLRSSNGLVAEMSSGTILCNPSDHSALDGMSESVNTCEFPETPPPISGLLLDPETPYREALAIQLLAPGQYKRGEGYPILSSADDFAWYIATVLSGLAQTTGLSRRISQMVGSQLTELISRVEALRPATVAMAVLLLKSSSTSQLCGEVARNGRNGDSGHVVSLASQQCTAPVAASGEYNPATSNNALVEPQENLPSANSTNIGSAELLPSANGGPTSHPSLPSEVVAAAAWVIGEYAELHDNPMDAARVILQYPTRYIDGAAQVALISALVKIFAVCTEEQANVVYSDMLDLMDKCLESDIAEVYERAWLCRQLVEQVGAKSSSELKPLFEGKLLPVDPRVQKQVPVPDGLDLEKSLLDTRGLSLHAYLTDGEESYMTDETRLDADDYDDVDMFDHLKNIGGTTGAAQRSISQYEQPSDSRSEKDRTRNLFYLGDDEAQTGSQIMIGRSRKGDDKNGHSNSALSAGNDVSSGFADNALLVSMSGPVAVFTGEDLPLGMVKYDLGDGRESHATTSSGALHAGMDGFDAAFEGAFSAGKDANDAGKSKRRRKRKSKAKEVLDVEKGVSLIDFEESVLSTCNPPEVRGNTDVPRHMGRQTDLLL